MNDKEIETQFNKEIVCPHCGYEFFDSWEYMTSMEVQCEECHKEFWMERNIEVTYSTEFLTDE